MGPGEDNEYGERLEVYIWLFEMVEGKSTLPISVEAPWPRHKKMEVNKVAAMDVAIQGADPSNHWVLLGGMAVVEKVRSVRMCFIP